jgi:hypothetical protein
LSDQNGKEKRIVMMEYGYGFFGGMGFGMLFFILLIFLLGFLVGYLAGRRR